MKVNKISDWWKSLKKKRVRRIMRSELRRSLRKSANNLSDERIEWHAEQMDKVIEKWLDHL